MHSDTGCHVRQRMTIFFFSRLKLELVLFSPETHTNSIHEHEKSALELLGAERSGASTIKNSRLTCVLEQKTKVLGAACKFSMHSSGG